MSALFLLIAIPFAGIHYINGGDPADLLPIASIVFMFWMLDMLVSVRTIANAHRRNDVK